MSTHEPQYVSREQLRQELELILDARLAKLELHLVAAFVTRTDFAELRRNVDELEHGLRRVKEEALNPDKVSSLIGTALQQASARGWTAKERLVTFGLFFVALAGVILSALNLH